MRLLLLSTQRNTDKIVTLVCWAFPVTSRRFQTCMEKWKWQCKVMHNSGNRALTVYTDVNNISSCKVKLLRATKLADKVHLPKSSILPWRWNHSSHPMHSTDTELSSPSSQTPSHSGHTVLSDVCVMLSASDLSLWTH